MKLIPVFVINDPNNKELSDRLLPFKIASPSWSQEQLNNLKLTIIILTRRFELSEYYK